MWLPRRAFTLLSVTILVTTPLALASGSASLASTEVASSRARAASAESAQVVLLWEGYSFDAVYPLLTSSIPGGVPVLGFTSLTMYDAARASLHRGNSSETAAVATAAHDVLVHYAPLLHTTATDTTTAPAVVAQLNTRLATTLAGVPGGVAKDKGERIGHRAAADFVDSRNGDHFRDQSIHYTLAAPLPAKAAPGLWQAAPPRTDMLEPWLGSLRPVVLDRLVRVNGPDGLRSYAYARDFNEVKRYGGAVSTRRSADETQTAYFFNSNSATMVGRALIGYLTTHPKTLRATSRIFGLMHGAMTDALIKCWKFKRDIGFWRPSQAIKRATEDRNPATTPDAGWTSLLPEPPYADYVSGHGCLTGPATETVRMTLGEETALHLVSANALVTVTERDYANLSDIETDALNSRIWGGLHFRDAMEDAYDIGRATARRVNRELD
ncbi:MAG: hypothetical protein JWR85_2202 [Marmoricola sp.]|nr:hypothetical protein [Marmoricola sp.]